MEELEKIADLRDKIKDYEEQLEKLNLKNTAPKNQIFSDMPKSSSEKNSIEEYVIKKEKIQEKIDCCFEDIKTNWRLAVVKFKKAGLSKVEIKLMKYRYLFNFKWKLCRKKMQKMFPETKWTDNRVFFTYRAIKDKLATNGEYI